MGREHGAVSSAQPLRSLHRDLALMAKDHTVPPGRNLVLVDGVCYDDEVNKVRGSPRRDRAFNAEDLPSNDFHFHVSVLVNRNLVTLELLVIRFIHLTLGIEVKPQLESNSRRVEACRHLRVNDAFASGHPLDVALSLIHI